MKKILTKPEDIKAYGILKPVVRVIFLLAILGTLLSGLTEWYSFYHSTEGGHLRKAVIATAWTIALEGGLRLFVFTAFYMLFESIVEPRAWKVAVLVLSSAAAFFCFNRSLNASIQGSDIYVEQSTQKPDTLKADHSTTLLEDEAAHQKFISDSLKVIADANTTYNESKRKHLSKKDKALTEKKRLRNHKDYDPTPGKFFYNSIKIQSSIIKSANKTVSDLKQTRDETIQDNLDNLRSQLQAAKSQTLLSQAKAETVTDSLNTANSDAYLLLKNSKKGEFEKYIWASLILAVLHAALYFVMLWAAGMRIKFESTEEDDIELKDLANEFWNAWRFRRHAVLSKLLSFMTSKPVVINDIGLNISYASQGANVEIINKKGKKIEVNHEAEPSFSSPTLPTSTSRTVTHELAVAKAEEEETMMNLNTSTPKRVEVTGFRSKKHTAGVKENETVSMPPQILVLQGIIKKLEKEGEGFKKTVADWKSRYDVQKSEAEQAQKHLAQERRKNISLKADNAKLQAQIDKSIEDRLAMIGEFGELKNKYKEVNRKYVESQASATAALSKIISLKEENTRLSQELSETKNKLSQKPETITETVTETIETVRTFDFSKTKQNLKRYIERAGESWTKSREDGIRRYIKDLVQHGYHVEVKDMSTTIDKRYNVGEKQAKVILSTLTKTKKGKEVEYVSAIKVNIS